MTSKTVAMILVILWLLPLASPSHAHAEPATVSLVALINSPANYDGQLISVTGFLRDRFEDRSLYLTREHAEAMVFSNAITVSLSKDEEKKAGGMAQQISKLQDRYVTIVGRFTAPKEGWVNCCAGDIRPQEISDHSGNLKIPGN